MSTTKVTGVPKARVPVVVRILQRAGATNIQVAERPDGLSDITATMPDVQDHASFKQNAAVAKAGA